MLRVLCLFMTTFACQAPAWAAATATPTRTPLPTLSCPRRVTEFYPYWVRGSIPPSAIPWSKLTHLTHAFIRPLADGSLDVPSGYLDASLNSAAHAAGVRVIASVGGAGSGSGGGSEFWDSVVLSATARAALVDNLYAFCLANGYDGVDIDYEFPHNSATRAGLTALVQALRAKFSGAPAPAPGWEISGDLSWGSYYGQWWDVAALKAVMDHFNLMVYDMYGSWTPVSGHNAALFDSSLPGAWSGYNGSDAISYYQSRGVPAQQLQYGLAAYGYRFATEDLYQSCVGGACPGTGLAYKDILPLIGSGWTRSYDSSAESPYLRADASAEVITYDDPQSIGAKTQEVLWNRGLGGVFLWELSQDDLGGAHPLLDAAWAAAQCPQASPTPSATPSPSVTASPSWTASPTVTPSPTISETHTISPTFSVSPTRTETFTPSPTPSISPTFSASPTPSPTPTAVPPAGGPLGVTRAVAVPQPNARTLKVELSGPAEQVSLKLFSPAAVLVASQRLGALPAGWSSLSLAPLLLGLPNGVYFGWVGVEGGGGQARAPKPFVVVLLR